jgi:glycosyltransferase involved in cell wall biosynthesis
MIKVTVYITAHNYGQYIDQAVESLRGQTFDAWELIIINDGSTDNTLEVVEKYRTDGRITIIDQENKGLAVSNNIALRLSRGQYIMRLDADDFLDENALVVLSSVLDSKPEVGLVYPDYYEVNPGGEVTRLVRRKKIGEDAGLLDLPAHGACTMFRKERLLQLGGYAEQFSCQDGYDIWLRFIHEFLPYNVNVPLFYYRQHTASLTKNPGKILDTRRAIKRQFVKNSLHDAVPKTLGVIPIVMNSTGFRDPFQKLAGRTLLDYTLEEATKSELLDKIVLASDNDAVIEQAVAYNDVLAIKRPESLSGTARMYKILQYVLGEIGNQYDYHPQAVCTLYVNTPLRKARHIDKAIDTMTIFNVDSVVSVEEELAFCYTHGQNGMQPLETERDIRAEKKGIYKENGAVYLSRVEVINQNRLVGESVGHITMLPEESVKINSAFEFWLAEKIIAEWKTQK